jgi:hypothetical protein
MVATSGYGILFGNPILLLTPWDFDKNGCGFNQSTLNYPYLYFPVVDPSILT